MENLDFIRQKNEAVLAQMHEAFKTGDEKAFGEAFTAFASNMQDSILKEAKEFADVNDSAVLASRGVRQLTSVEKDYYNKLGDAMRSTNPKAALAGMENVLPETTVDEVFKYLEEKHPLLSMVNFTNTGAVVKFLRSTSTGVAIWGELCGTITSELGGAFQVADMTLMKLSAFFPVCNAMLDLGPSWLDKWVRTVLAAAIAVGLEEAIVDGDGNKKPIGMTRKLTGAVDGVYARKTPIEVNSLDPVTIGGILATVSQAPNGKTRDVPTLLMIVNPNDYFTKVFPATTVRATDGTWNNNVFPYNIIPVRSAAVPANRAVFGKADEYFIGLGTGKDGKIEESDHAKFLEDMRVYRVKLYGNGSANDENAFILADITNLKPVLLQVEVNEIPEA